MENNHIVSFKLILGGALLGAFLVLVMPVFAYDQNNTHPALTDEIVDFYNLSFPDKKITEEEKQQLVQGAIDEDEGIRMLYHFYDPVYNRGLAIVAGASSKDWGLAVNFQANVLGRQYAGFTSVFNDSSEADFSYGRALMDYAKGDRKRAFYAFGHVLHLLEDAGVPDHTRNDPHPPLLNFGSPYEHEMAKWNPQNFQIARSLFLKKEKPASLDRIESYLDRVANYSNNNFFSKDTVLIDKYSGPTVDFWSYQKVSSMEKIIGYKINKNDRYVLVEQLLPSNVYSIINISILDGYWERLSKEVVINGAGTLNLFLEEAEKAEQKYLAKAKQKRPSFWAQLLDVFGITVGKDDKSTELTTPDVGTTSGVNDSELSTLPTSDVGNPQVTKDGDSGDTSSDKKVSPSPSPVLSPIPIVSPSVSPTPTPTPWLSTTEKTEKININTANKELLMTLKGIKDAKSEAIIQHRQTYGQFQKIEDIMNVSGIGQATFNDIKDQITVGNVTPTPTPVTIYSGGGGGGSSPTPTPSLSVTPTPVISPSPSLSPSPGPEGDANDDSTANPNDIVINEIAWMGSDIGGTATQNANAEWIELYNTTNQTINLVGWTLIAQDGTPNVILSGSISPFSYYLLERTSDNSVMGIGADQIYTGALGNSGEHLILKDSPGIIIDQVDGSGGWKLNGGDKVIGDNTTKETAQRVNNEWVTASSTPRAQNSTNIVQNPSAVTNLAAAHNSPTITATWSAPDPGSYDLASLSYDLRYSSTNFPDNDTWDAAIKVASSSLPSVGIKGASQSASFSVGYKYGQTLYFALKTKVIHIPTCDVGNMDKCSGISNVAAASFLGAIDTNAWAMLGKDQYHTSFTANTVGPGLTATISWEFDAGVGNEISQPVADADGNIYFGAANGSPWDLIKLDKNGVKQWKYETNVSIGTPAVLSDGAVYFGRIGAGGFNPFTALNNDGSNRWDYNGTGSVRKMTVAVDGSAYFATNLNPNSRLQVLSPSGNLQAEKIGPGFYDFSPVVLEDGTIIVVKHVSGNQSFNAYSSDGIQVWPEELSYGGAFNKLPSDPSHDKSIGTTYSAAGSKLFSIPQDGSVLNSYDIAPWDYAAATMVAITADTLYVGFNNNVNLASGSLLYALNKSDFSAKWFAPFQADGLINKQLAVDGAGNAYFSIQNGKLFSVDNTGHQRWLIETGLDSAISPILTENGLVWGYGNKIVVISE